MQKINWGILSTANIGVKKVIPALQRGEYCNIVGIASRDLGKAQTIAVRLGIPQAYGSYETMLADPGIQAVYIPVPNHLHVEWSIKSLAAGKHVLCEKPIALNVAQAQSLVEAAKNYPRLKVMEAFMYRFHPQWQRAQQLVRDGKIGQLKTIQSFFSYNNPNPANIRNQADIGGGGMMDIGCYNLSLARFIFEREPERVCGIVEYDPVFKTDRLASGMLDFGDGTAAFTCATQMSPYQRVNIFGTAGRIEIEIPFNAPPDVPCKMWHQHDGQTDEIVLNIVDQYTLQGDAFALAIINNTPVPTPLEDAAANMKLIDAIFQSAKTNQWIQTK